jgi:hypothetical protein
MGIVYFNVMFHKSTTVLIFLIMFTFIQIEVFFFIFYPQFHQIQHNFHRHTLYQQHEAITLSYFTLHFLV